MSNSRLEPLIVFPPRSMTRFTPLFLISTLSFRTTLSVSVIVLFSAVAAPIAVFSVSALLTLAGFAAQLTLHSPMAMTSARMVANTFFIVHSPYGSRFPQVRSF